MRILQVKYGVSHATTKLRIAGIEIREILGCPYNYGFGFAVEPTVTLSLFEC